MEVWRSPCSLGLAKDVGLFCRLTIKDQRIMRKVFWLLAINILVVALVDSSATAKCVRRRAVLADRTSTTLKSRAIAQGGIALSGTAEDPNGAVVPGERISLINKATGETKHTVTDGAGHFTFAGVAPGEYLLRGEAEGFQTAEVSVTVGTQFLKPIVVRMQISVAEEVTITATDSRQPDAPENNADAVNFNLNWLRSLPSLNQDIVPVLSNFLSPGSQSVSGPSIVVDGMEDSELNFPPEAIRRVAINRNPYSAEFRRPGSSRIEVTTRYGSHGHYDGSVAYFVRNSAFDARNPMAIEKPHLDRRLFEGTFSGPVPVIRHTRFFFTGNRLSNNEDAVVNALIPSGPLRENVPTSLFTTNFLERIDVRPHSKNAVTLIYTFHDQAERNRGVGGLRLREQGISADDHTHKFQLSESSAVSGRFLNDFRFLFEWRRRRQGNRAITPEIQVKGAFIGGPSTIARLNREARFEFQDIATVSRGLHTFRFGGAFRPRSFNSSDATNFNGTFIFSDLASFEQGRPIQFQIVQGTPEVSFSQDEAYGFFQDEMKLTPHMDLTLGVRYEWQAKVHDLNNFGPRVAFAYAPGEQKTVFRAGAGIFYDRLPDMAVQRSLLVNGTQTRETIIKQPSFADPFGGRGSVIPPSIWSLAPDLREPYLFQGTLSVERRLWGTTHATIEFQTLRAVHLFRARNVNASGAGGVRPDPHFLLIRQVESSGTLRGNALVATLQGSFTKFFKGRMQYTFSRTTDDTSGPFDLSANSLDLRPERGRSDFDRLHVFNFAGTFDLPHGFRMGTVLTISSGAPFNITTGFDDNGDGIVNDRPPGVTRNTGQGPGFAALDLRLSKLFSVWTPFPKKSEPGRLHKNLHFNLDLFNVFNRSNLTNVIGTKSSPLFGQPNAALPPRTLQFSMKYIF